MNGSGWSSGRNWWPLKENPGTVIVSLKKVKEKLDSKGVVLICHDPKAMSEAPRSMPAEETAYLRGDKDNADAMVGLSKESPARLRSGHRGWKRLRRLTRKFRAWG